MPPPVFSGKSLTCAGFLPAIDPSSRFVPTPDRTLIDALSPYRSQISVGHEPHNPTLPQARQVRNNTRAFRARLASKQQPCRRAVGKIGGFPQTARM
jgi:hypothetical protein